MEEKNKKSKPRKHDIAGPAAAIALALVAFALVLGPIGAPVMQDTAKFQNPVIIEVRHPSCAVYPENPKCGQPSEVQYTKNTVTERGLNWTRDALQGNLQPEASTNNWTVLELSTSDGTPQINTTTCSSVVTGSGLDIARGAIVNQTYGNYTVSKTWSVSGSVTGIQKVCLSNITTSASVYLMASALFSSTNVASGDTLTVNYSIAVR
jgi:hypothetical protein